MSIVRHAFVEQHENQDGRKAIAELASVIGDGGDGSFASGWQASNAIVHRQYSWEVQADRSLEFAQHIVLQAGLLGAHEAAVERIHFCDAHLGRAVVDVPLSQLLQTDTSEMAYKLLELRRGAAASC